jgi:hypothetical protein
MHNDLLMHKAHDPDSIRPSSEGQTGQNKTFRAGGRKSFRSFTRQTVVLNRETIGEYLLVITRREVSFITLFSFRGYSRCRNKSSCPRRNFFNRLRLLKNPSAFVFPGIVQGPRLKWIEPLVKDSPRFQTPCKFIQDKVMFLIQVF